MGEAAEPVAGPRVIDAQHVALRCRVAAVFRYQQPSAASHAVSAAELGENRGADRKAQGRPHLERTRAVLPEEIDPALEQNIGAVGDRTPSEQDQGRYSPQQLTSIAGRLTSTRAT